MSKLTDLLGFTEAVKVIQKEKKNPNNKNTAFPISVGIVGTNKR